MGIIMLPGDQLTDGLGMDGLAVVEPLGPTPPVPMPMMPTALAEGWEPAVDYARSVATRFVTEALAPSNCTDSLTATVAVLREWAAVLPVQFVADLGHVFDWLAVRAADPAIGGAVSGGLLRVVMPLLQPPKANP